MLSLKNKAIALLIGIMVLAGLAACGGGGGGGGGAPTTNSGPVYTPAPKGVLIGTPVTQTIDAKGGTMMSSDGRIGLTIPAGALSAATAITIQSITNTAPNGAGVGYRLEPEGTTFSSPVTLTFHLDAVQALGIDSAFVVSQHADGLWYSQPHQARDATAATVSVPAKHFSDWVLAKTVLLKPQQTRVKTSQTANFTATVIIIKDVDTGDDSLVNPLGDDEVAVPAEENVTNQFKNPPPSWQVNGVNGGTDTFGHIAESNGTGVYKAPGTVPNPSEVTVSLTVMLGKTKVIAPAKATIYDQEIWKGMSHVTLADGTVVDSTFVFAQTSDDGHGKVTFNVQSGHVHATVPATLPSGCTQTATPTDYAIGPNDGSMTATYDLASGGESPMVAGMGDTVWQATYTTVCPNGPGSIQAAIQADWWPWSTSSAPTPVRADAGVYDNYITTLNAWGTVHLVRQ